MDKTRLREQHYQDALAIANKAAEEKRDLTNEEQQAVNLYVDQIDELDRQANLEKTRKENQRAAEQLPINRGPGAVTGRRILDIPGDAVAALHTAGQQRQAFSWAPETRAALTVSSVGTDVAHEAYSIRPPATLADFCIGLNTPMQFDVASFGLPTATTGVAEGASTAEYAAVTNAVTTCVRFGRYTSYSIESSLVGTGALLRSHVLAIALDVNKAVVSAVSTAAGTAQTFATSVDNMVRKGIATAQAQVLVDAGELTLILNPSDLAGLAGLISPVDAGGQASVLSTYAGARIYPSTAVTAGTAYIAALGVGVVFGTARGLSVRLSPEDPATAQQTAGTSLIGAPAVALPGACVAVKLA